MILSAQNSRHLAVKMREPLLNFIVKQFADGEFYYLLKYKKKPASVDLMANITSDPYSLFELMSLVQAAQDNNIRIKRLIIPYLAYSRQDRLLKKGEAIMAKMVCSQLNKIACSKMLFLSIHSDYVRRVLHPHKEMEAITYLVSRIRQEYDIVIAPDRGAKERAQLIAHAKEIIVMPKHRPRADIVKREKKKYRVKGKKLLIVDDIIDTGRTIATAAELLKKQGAEIIDVAAVHGVFSPPSVKILKTKAVDNIYVSDSLKNKKQKKVKVVSIVELLK